MSVAELRKQFETSGLANVPPRIQSPGNLAVQEANPKPSPSTPNKIFNGFKRSTSSVPENLAVQEPDSKLSPSTSTSNNIFDNFKRRTTSVPENLAVQEAGPRPTLSTSNSTPNNIFNNLRRGASDVTKKGKDVLQTGGRKTIDSITNLRPSKPSQNVDEIEGSEIQMIDNDANSIQYIEEEYGEDFIKAAESGVNDLEDTQELVSPDTTSSQDGGKPSTKWQLPNPKKIEELISGRLKVAKNALQTGTATIGQKSSDVWQGSTAQEVSIKLFDDLSDFKNAVLRKAGICSECRKLSLNNMRPSSSSGTSVIVKVALERVLYHSNWCRLCRYFLRHLQRPENDPFRNPIIRDYLQPQYENKSFRQWTVSKSTLTDKNWPFGFGKKKHQGPFNYLDPLLANHLYKRHTTAVWPVIADIIVAGTVAAMERELNPTSQDNRNISSEYRNRVRDYSARRTQLNNEYNKVTQFENLMYPLECYLEVTTPTHDILRLGQVDVGFYAHGRGFRAKLSLVSSFRLRLEDEGSLEYPLRYGSVVDPYTIDVGLAAKWLHQCESIHGKACSEHSWSDVLQPPTLLRVIDVEDNCIVQAENLDNFRFLALSYIWGSQPRNQLEGETIQLKTTNIDLLMRRSGLRRFINQIPRTVRDAIDITKRLGERYLWVDSFCIIQDIDNQEKHQLIGAMGWIYGKAILTVVAADSESAMAGIRGVRPNSRTVKQEKIEITGGTLLTPIEAPQDLDTSPWNRRAWTFQERLLSRRLLIFLGDQMIWHCRSSIYHEDMISTDTGFYDPPLTWLKLNKQYMGSNGSIDGSIMVFQDQTTHVVRSETFKQYANLVQEYTHRQMKYDDDMLRAFAGLLHILRQSFKLPLRDGLPEILLDVALLWQPIEQLERRPSSENAKFPSWSWAGWKGWIRYPTPFYADIDYHTGSLKRVPLREQEDRRQERIRPLLCYYTKNATTGQLQPLNKTGLGIPLFSKTLPQEWEKTPFAHFPPDSKPTLKLSNQDLSPAILQNIDEHTLVFKTTSLKNFHIQKSTTQDLDIVLNSPQNTRTGRPRPPSRFEITSSRSQFLGTLLLDLSDENFYLRAGEGGDHELILISEAQFLGLDFEDGMSSEEQRNEYRFYNVMLVEWVPGRIAARRVGLGRVWKDRWVGEELEVSIVCLR